MKLMFSFSDGIPLMWWKGDDEKMREMIAVDEKVWTVSEVFSASI